MLKYDIQLFADEEVSKNVKIQQKTASGMVTLYPVTKAENVEGLNDLVNVKTLDTTATTAQSTNASESLKGTGTITLHKVSKTGSYDDLLNKPTIDNNNQKVKANGTSFGDNVSVDIKGTGLISVTAGTNEMTISTTAQANVIETVKVNGSALTPSNKAVDITVPTKTSDLTNDGDGTNAFITNATAQIAESQVTNLTTDLQNIREVAEGKTKTYIIDAQSDITGTKNANDEYTNVTAITGVTIANLQLGDTILIKALQVPDYWVSGLNKTGSVVTSVSLNKLETTKVDLNGYVTGSSLTADNIILGNGNSTIKDSGKAISTAKPISTSTDNQIPTSKAVYTGLAEKVTANTAITGATHTKITYDEKGLVTAGADLAESDIPTLSISKTSGLQTALDNKLDDSQLKTSWSSTVSDSNIPSEKLVKDSLDAKLDDSQLKTSWSSTTSDSNIPSEKLVKDSLDGKLTASTAKVQLTGDVTSSAVSLTNGTASVATTLANSGVTAGTYSAVQVNAKGLVTSGAQMIEVGTAGQTTPSASLAVGGIFYQDVTSS